MLGAGVYFRKTIDTLRKNDNYVIAIDKDPLAPGKESADEFYPIDLADANATLELCRKLKVEAVMNLNEFGARTASYVSAKLGLNGHSKTTVDATCDKGLMRDIWKRADLSMPEYYVFTEAGQALEFAKSLGFPCILKPADSGGSGRGISVIRSETDVEWAYQFASGYARNGRFILERFVDGIEMTIESFSVNGMVYMLAMSDKIKPDLRTRVATSLNYPAHFDDEIIQRVAELVREAVLALGINNGIAHTEVIVDNGIPYLVETAARGGGGHIFHTIIEVVSGYAAPVLQANWLLGRPVEISKIEKNGCCYRFFNPPHGILKAVRNVDQAMKLDGVVDLGIVKQIGDEVGNLENSLHRAGFVVTKGRDRAAAIKIADDVEALIEFEVEPK